VKIPKKFFSPPDGGRISFFFSDIRPPSGGLGEKFLILADPRKKNFLSARTRIGPGAHQMVGENQKIFFFCITKNWSVKKKFLLFVDKQ